MTRHLALFALLVASTSSLFAQLSGTYTIGGTAPDYATITAAVADLDAVGISGATTFNIRPGVYSEQITLNPITGTSESNTILFQSETLNQDDVEWTFDMFNHDGLPHSTIILAGCEYIQFKHLTFSLQNEGDWELLIDGSAWHMLFQYCRFDGSFSGSCSNVETNVGIYVNNGSLDWTVVDNLFDGTCSGFTFAYGTDWVIERNVFDGGTYAGFTGYSDGVTFNDNIAINDAILFTSDNVNFEILRNQWNGRFVFDGETGTADNPTLMANNFLTGIYGMEIYAVNHLQIYNNSFHNGLCIYGSYAGPDMKNNIFYASNEVFRGVQDFIIEDSDNNTFYSVNGPIADLMGNISNTLEDWQNDSGFDSNSFELDPLYVSNSDLHVCHELLDGAGLAFDFITDDFDGEPRPAGPLDIGADEFNLTTCACTLGASIEVTSDYNGSDISCWLETDGALEVIVEGAVGDINYSWADGPDTATRSNLGPGTYTCTVTDDACEVEVEITLEQPAAITVETISILDPTCGNDAGGELTFNASGGTGDYAWTWPNGVSTSNEGVNLEGGSYPITVTDINGCQGFGGANLLTIVYPDLEITGDTELCEGESTTLTVTGAVSYEWQAGLGDEDSIEVTPTMNTTYEVIGTSETDCTASTLIMVTVNPNPTVTLDFDYVIACENESPFELPAGSPTGGTYSGDNIEASQMNIENASLGINTYAYTYTDGNGCTGSDDGEVDVIAAPDVIMNEFNESPVCLDAPAITLPAALPADGEYSGPGISTGEFLPSEAGVGVWTIVYTYENGDGCVGSASVEIEVQVCTTIEAELAKDWIQVYPNPSDGQVSLLINNPEIETIEILSSDGKLIHATATNIAGFEPIDLTLSSGVYFIRSRADLNTNTIKFIVR